MKTADELRAFLFADDENDETWVRTPHRIESGRVRVGDLLVDDSYQRPPHKGRVAKIAAHWDERYAGSLIVSQRDDGKQYVIDGNRRRLAACQIDPDMRLPATIHFGLTVPEEADMFAKIGRDREPIGTGDLWEAKTTAGDEMALSIAGVLRRHGLVLVSPNRTHSVQSDLTSAYAVKEVTAIAEKRGLIHLDEVFDLVLAAWGRANKPGYSGAVLAGVSTFLARHRANVKWDLLVRRLSEVMPTVLLAEGKAMHLRYGLRLQSEGTAEAIRVRYNRQLRSNRLKGLKDE